MVSAGKPTKTVHVDMGEGAGPYSCTAGACAANPFVTDNREEFDKHIAETKHYRQGVAPCAICHKEVNMDEFLTLAGEEPVHDEHLKPREKL